MDQQTVLTGIAIGAVVLGAVLNHVAHSKSVRALETRVELAEKHLLEFYRAHTTPTERLIVDEVARAGLAALSKEFPTLEARVVEVEKGLASLGAAATAAKGA